MNTVITNTKSNSVNGYVIILGIVAFVVIVIIVCKIFSALAMRYAKKNKEKLLKSDLKFFKELEKEKNWVEKSLKTYNSGGELFGIDQNIRCSSSVVVNAENNPVKYAIKYTKLDSDTGSLIALDFFRMFLRRHASFVSKMDKASQKICEQLPGFYRVFINSKKLPYNLWDIDYTLAKEKEFQLRFVYSSPAGRSGRRYSIKFDEKILSQIESEISKNLTKEGHKKAQRSAMTNDLREAIKKRDNYTCQKCGNSVLKEPNLLLEVDHIVPIAKGGKTEADNLQTLCWRCNRKKGGKKE